MCCFRLEKCLQQALHLWKVEGKVFPSRSDIWWESRCWLKGFASPWNEQHGQLYLTGVRTAVLGGCLFEFAGAVAAAVLA